MLPAFIIEQLKKQEAEKEERRQPRPYLELPLCPPRAPAIEPKEEDEQRGVTIIEMF